MTFTTYDEVKEFLDVVDTCQSDVFLRSPYGDVYNLKSKLSQYLGVAALLSEHGEELELFCADKREEPKLIKFLSDHHDQILGL